jgi:hypothetical protein
VHFRVPVSSHTTPRTDRFCAATVPTALCMPASLKRHSCCELECDLTVHHILNRGIKQESEFACSSLEHLWSEERRRAGPAYSQTLHASSLTPRAAHEDPRQAALQAAVADAVHEVQEEDEEEEGTQQILDWMLGPDQALFGSQGESEDILSSQHVLASEDQGEDQAAALTEQMEASQEAAAIFASQVELESDQSSSQRPHSPIPQFDGPGDSHGLEHGPACLAGLGGVCVRGASMVRAWCCLTLMPQRACCCLTRMPQ